MRTSRAEIDLAAIQQNIRKVAAKVGPAVRVLGVVKANAYGHGLVQVARAVTEAGATYLGVAIAEEGVALRQHTNIPILVFSPPTEENLEDYVRFDLDATITSMETAYALDAIAGSAGKRVRVQIKVDTGMGRLGFFPKNAVEAFRTISNLESLSLVGVYSHLATSDEVNKEFAKRQLISFKNVVTAITDVLASSARSNLPSKSPKTIFHIANSGAILDLPGSFFDMVRPGIMAYGYYPSFETTQSVDIRPALTLRSSLVQVKTFQPGMSISYGRKYFTRKSERVGVVPIGYGDGFTSLLTGKASVLINGKKYPIVGTITMDHIMVGLGDDYEVQKGDEVVLIGKCGDAEISAWDLASELGTIPYEILCMINNRVPRIYLNSNTPLTD